MEIVQCRAQQAVRFEEGAMRQVVETGSKAKANLDEQRFALIDQANYDFNLLEARSESTKFTVQLRQRDDEVDTKCLDCEKPRQEQYLLLTELQSRERAHQETSNCARDEVEEFRKTRRSEAKLCEEAYQDVVSHEGEKILDTE